MPAKKVLCTTVIADVYGPSGATTKQIRRIEQMIHDTLRAIAADLKSDQFPNLKGFRLRITQ